MSKYPGRIVTDLAPAGYSVYFDGTGDYLSVANNAALNVGSGDFCIEAWFNVSTVASQQSIVSNAGASGSDNTQIDIVSGNIRFASSATVWLTGSAVTTNTWNHVVVSRSGTTMSLFLNGSRQATATNSTNFANANNYATIVGGYPPSTALFTGYISNVRIVKGSSVYDPTQTTLRVPTQLLNITNTSLLTCQSPAIIDNSTNNFAITANGNAAVSTLTPFPAYVPYNPALGASTPGVWTVDEAMQAAATRQWNMYDPYFNLTTLLLHGNGTNGAQNNTFLDSSSNNFSITRNGNTTQGTFSPFSQTGWGNYFDGSGDYLSAAYNSAFAFPGDFTIEFWVNWSAHGSSGGFVTNMQPSGGAPAGWQIVFNGANDTVSLEVAGAYPFITSSSTLPKNTWAHVAVVRSGSATNNVKMYFNGVQVAQGTNTSTLDSTNASLFIGCERTGGAFITGYISNVRIVKGTAVYTTAFTPPAAPLTAITNTSLLTCQSNRFIDNSTNAFAITRNGDVSVQAFSPFLPTVAYTPQTIGGSGYFDGTGDYLSTPDNAAFDLGTGDFTFECWLYKPNNNDVSMICSAANGLDFAYVSGSLRMGRYPVAWDVTELYTIPQNAWTHIAFVKASGRTYLFANGTLLNAGGTANTNSYDVTTTLFIGVAGDTTSRILTGYMAGVRLIKGQALATASFTPPTSPVTTSAVGWTGAASSITGTVSLLLNYTNAGVVDSTADNVLETVGNAQISTTISRFGGSSIFMDGNGDYLQVAPNQLFDLRTSDFTLEFWVYPTSFAVATYPIYSQFNRSTTNAFAIEIRTTGRVDAYVTNAGGAAWSLINAGELGTVTLNTWNHVAFVRNGTAFRGYVNGVQGALATNSSNTIETFNGFNIGAVGAGTAGYFTGYFDEYRISRYARYTGAFTPQTSQWQDQ
jgi:hypothetical protein